ncbi:hypothetical protein DFH06DRAFT_1136031 [Mycena polygramma]|nr:hypothetical protein DFH06DRAFT_1136031 [Mycena polygramma]
MLCSRSLLLLAALTTGASPVAAHNTGGSNSRSWAIVGALVGFSLLVLCFCGVRRRMRQPANDAILPLTTSSHFTSSKYPNGGVPVFTPAPVGLPSTVLDSEYLPPTAAEYAPPPYVKESGDAPELYAPPPGPPPAIDAVYSLSNSADFNGGLRPLPVS